MNNAGFTNQIKHTNPFLSGLAKTTPPVTEAKTADIEAKAADKDPPSPLKDPPSKLLNAVREHFSPLQPLPPPLNINIFVAQSGHLHENPPHEHANPG